MARHNREATAYHEAGHAVIALLLGLSVKRATIVPTDDTHGRVLHQSPLAGIRLDTDGSDRARLRVEKAIKVAIAGPIAQRKFKPSSCRQWHFLVDYDRIADLALSVCGSDESATAFIRWLELETKALVESHWQDIQRLAEALLRRDTLTASEIREVMTKVSENDQKPAATPSSERLPSC